MVLVYADVAFHLAALAAGIVAGDLLMEIDGVSVQALQGQSPVPGML